MAVHPKSSTSSADLVYTDDLTGLRNRRFLYQVFGEGWGEVTADDSELSLAIVDLDYFKQVNDTHGHLTGDLVLAESATLIQSFLGEDDHAIRYGGDEFVLLIPGHSKSKARDLADQLRSAMADKEFVSKEENQPLEVVLSFSIGVATFPEDGSTGDELVAAADKALYASKKAGRNRVTVSGDLPAGLEDEIDKFRTFPCRTVVGRQGIIEALGGLCELINLGTSTWTALSGPAGIGKTRLLSEALRSGLDAGISCALVNLAEDEALQPYSGVARLLAEVGARYEDAREDLLREAEKELLTFLRAHAPEFATDAIETPKESVPSPKVLKPQLLAAIRRLCERHKWLFILDEVPNLDPYSAELLKSVVEAARQPIGIVSAHRSGDQRVESQPGVVFLETLDRKPWLDRRTLEPLPQEAMDTMVSVLLPHLHAPAEFSSVLYEVTAGNPLFIEEVLRLGIAKESITRRGGEWFVKRVDRQEMPVTLEEAIGERMSVLDSEIGDGISQAAAIGTSLTPNVLQALLGKNEGEVLDFLDKAREQGFVEGGQWGDMNTVRFASTIFRDQAYERMSEADRTRAHREIGKIEEHRAGSLVGALANRLAYHFERGEVYEKAKAYLDAASVAAPPIVVAGSWDASEVPKHRRRRITEAAIPLSDEAWPSLDSALRSIAQASKALWMYPQGSPMANAAFEDLHHQLEALFEHADVVSFAAVEDSLVVNGVPYPAKRQEFLVRGLLDQLRSREIRGFTLRQGLTEAEASFLVQQLASNEPVERDPEVWVALLESQGIENVDFGDRVYVPAEGVANAPIASSDMQQLRSGVIRVATAEEMEAVVRETSAETVAEDPQPESETVASNVTLSSRDLKTLFNRLEADESIDAEIETLVPIVADLLKKLLETADDGARLEHRDLARAVGLETGDSASVSADDAAEIDYLRHVRTDGESAGVQRLWGPAEHRFEAYVHARDLDRAVSIVRFLQLCEQLDDGEGDLAAASQESLAAMASGGAVPLLLEDLTKAPEKPNRRAVELLRRMASRSGPALATFVRETDDLRARRVVAKVLREIGGEAAEMALDAVTHGDNPVVARRVVAVLDDLSTDLTVDLSRAVTVRNPAILGETIKVLQRQPRPVQLQVIGLLLDSASPDLVCRGVYYLSEWNFTEAKDSVLMLLRESEDFEILAAVTAAVARWQLPEAVPILGELLRRKQVMKIVPVFPRGLRREFARALAAIGTPGARDELAELTKDVDPEVRNIARGLPAPTGA